MQEMELHPRIREVPPSELDPLLRDGCVLAVVDQRQRDLGQDAILARGADRQREMGKTALEQCGVGPVRDDADGQRRGKHEGVGFMAAWMATGNDDLVVRHVEWRKIETASTVPPRSCLLLTEPRTWPNRAFPATPSSPSPTRSSNAPACAPTSRGMSPTSSSPAISSATRRTASRCSNPTSRKSKAVRWRKRASRRS